MAAISRAFSNQQAKIREIWNDKKFQAEIERINDATNGTVAIEFSVSVDPSGDGDVSD